MNHSVIKITNNPKKFYSPLRYPGGKASLSMFLSEAISCSGVTDCVYVEPFAGGAGAALTLLFLEKVDRIVINDFDIAIYSFWKSLIEESQAFIEKVFSIPVTIDEWRIQKAIYEDKTSHTFDLGFATFFLNRTNRSGIIEGGPIGGLEQKGKWPVSARFHKEHLADRIKKIARYKSRIEVLNLDGIKLMRKFHRDPSSFIYIDPPYYVKGSLLYLNSYEAKHHKALSKFLNSNPDSNWLLTYDNVPEIVNLYKERKQAEFNLSYHINLPKSGKEILVLSDNLKQSQLLSAIEAV